MAKIEELKRRINIVDLAERLGLKKGKGSGANWHAPGHTDKNASLSISEDKGLFKDWSNPDAKGDIVDLVCYVHGCDKPTAMKWLHEAYAIPFDQPKAEARPERSRIEYIADQVLKDPAPVVEYLRGRGIADDVVEHAIRQKVIGWNTWNSATVPAGEVGHGGPAAAFIVKTLNPGRVVAVDLRYIDPELNGGNKTSCQGEKHGFGWTSNIRRLMDAETVYIVESPVNALSIESCKFPRSAAFAIRGVGNIGNIDWTWLRNKQAIIALDHTDPVNEKSGYRPGLQAAWQLHEALTQINVSAMFVNMEEWEEGHDINDVLKAEGHEKLARRLKQLEPWLIQGLPGASDKGGRTRMFLPAHDFANYWRFRVREDFTHYIDHVEKDEETGEERFSTKDLASFRIAAISRISVQSATATMTGDEDLQPTVNFSVLVQSGRHGASLQRRVFQDEELHNVDKWGKFGSIFAPASFKRMIAIMERAAHIGAKQAINFVGLAWRNGQMVINEGPDCYFTDPDKQCPYHNLTFPSGSVEDARQVVSAYQATFLRNAATIPLVWALGGHLKALLGFWPHIVVQADKGAGKSTLIKRLERSLAFTMLSGQSLQTEFRLVTSISHTSHPVGWEELSARKQEIIDKAVGLLQENYQYTVSRRGSDMTEYLLTAPVMLAGEDVPVRSLIGKIVRTELSHKKGKPIAENLPRFPLRQWLQFLAKLDKGMVNDLYRMRKEECLKQCRASSDDDGAMRMAGNYAAILTAWTLLSEFANFPAQQGDFEGDLIAEMNAHISETGAERAPWVWIMETALSEIAANKFQHPYAFDDIDGETVLLVRTGFIMDHIANTNALRDFWNGLPVKSDRVFKKQLISAGVIVMDAGQPKPYERTIGTKRVPHLVAMPLKKLEQYGLHAVRSDRPMGGYA